MRFTDHALDMMATRLSQFTNPNIPELSLKDEKTLQNSLIGSVVGIFGGEANAGARHRVTNLVRRIFASTETYQLGRQHALDYIRGDRHTQITPYFNSLTFFESCLAYCWQIGDLMYKILKPEGIKVFEQSDGSPWQRLHAIHTFATKHWLGTYADNVHGEMPTAVWLTNDGKCISGALKAVDAL
jgi:hypothetical protein